jgi:hypothetical protein
MLLFITLLLHLFSLIVDNLRLLFSLIVDNLRVAHSAGPDSPGKLRLRGGLEKNFKEKK